MEPHFHFSQIEQAVGRAIRNNSHSELTPENRNCTIFYHTTQYPKGVDIETVDILYRIAMKKDKLLKLSVKLFKKIVLHANSLKMPMYLIIPSFLVIILLIVRAKNSNLPRK